MTEKEMAQEIGELLLKYQVRVMALEAQVRGLSRDLGQENPVLWGGEIGMIEGAFAHPPFSQCWRDKCDQLSHAFDEATPDAPLIHALHHHFVEHH
jgi:hypothetical protein